MADGTTPDASPAPGRGDGFVRRDEAMALKTKAMIGVAGLVLLFLGWLIAVAWLPRWWARRIGNQVDGSMTSGVLFGLVIGFVFTAVPLFVARFALKRDRRWKHRAIIVLGALFLAVPNLATLGIVFGNGNAAHAGERILDVDGPGFRGGSVFGAVFGFALPVLVWYAFGSRNRQRRKANELRAQADKSAN